MSRLVVFPDQLSYYNLGNELSHGSADHSGELRALINKKGAGVYYIPHGMTINLPIQHYSTAPSIRDHVYFKGDGPESVVNVPGTQGPSGNDGNYTAIALNWNTQTEDVTGFGFEDMMFKGDAVITGWSQWQSAVIRVLGFGKRQDNARFRRVTFRDLGGFSVHADGGSYIKHGIFDECDFINTGNGLNWNGDFGHVTKCYFTNCEGIENAAIGALFDYNIFENIFEVAISCGGNLNVRNYPGPRIICNEIYGVRGGSGFGSGQGIITAQSNVNIAILANYIERTYSFGVQTTHSGSSGPDDHHIVAWNHAQNCGNPGGGTAAYYIATPYTDLIGNYALNRSDLSGDTYPVTTYRSLYGALIGGDYVVMDLNNFDMSNGGQYPINFTGTRVGLVAGKNFLIPGSGFPAYSASTTVTMADASSAPVRTVSAANYGVLSQDVRTYKLSNPGVNRATTLLHAGGWAGLKQHFINSDPTFTWTLNCVGTETFEDGTTSKIVGPNSRLTLESDGITWMLVNQRGSIA